MSYRQIRFSRNDEEILALLSMFPFEAFQEEKNHLIGYIEEDYCGEAFYDELELLCSSRALHFKSEIVEEMNWNKEWESSFKPVVVEDFCAIKATFHDEPLNAQYTILIDPKMAFGTGHHETTFMMVKAMKNILFDNQVVLDHGCGTGILSILAEKCGASHIDAVDIEENSFKNTQENILLNKCHLVTPIFGDISSVISRTYDVILANINRKVLIDKVSEHAQLLKSGGKLLISGILTEDIDLIKRMYSALGFKKIDLLNRGNWACIIFSI